MASVHNKLVDSQPISGVAMATQATLLSTLLNYSLTTVKQWRASSIATYQGAQNLQPTNKH